MIYNTFQDLKLSALGLGAMRFPVIDGDDSRIHIPRVKEMVAYAMEQGINYFDTAWGYHGGMSETVMGQVLRDYPRGSFYLASKFPGFGPENMSKKEEIFEKQLEKCQVEYFDFYLFHNVCESNIDDYLSEEYGLFDYLTEQKKQGRIRHLGFSGHGSVAVLRRFLEKFSHGIEFGQLQINWLDWDFQSAKEKYELLKSYNIPVWVMEPLRGGKLCALEPEQEASLKALRPEENIPAWGFRFLQSLPEVTMILSGMSNLEQIAENCSTFSSARPLNEEEGKAISAIADDMIAKSKVPCTACRYCTPKCPQELDIPRLLERFNEQVREEAALSELAKGPGDCIGCRSCEQVCPQGIRISDIMSDFCERLK